MSEPVVTATLILLLLGAGEFISILTKARVPMLLVVVIGYLILLWTDVFPQDMVGNSTLSAFGAMMVAPLIVHMGTLVPFKLLKSQVKSVVIALSGIVMAVILVLAVVPLLFDYASAVAGVGPLTGGTIAFVLTVEALQDLDLSSLIVVPALVIASQKLIGMPLASFFLRRHAKYVKETMCTDEVMDQTSEENLDSFESNKKKTWIPAQYQTNLLLLLQIFIGGSLAVFLADLTGINYSLWALFIGIIGALLGFYNTKMLERANSFGIAMAGLIIFTIGSMDDVTPSMFVGYIPLVVTIMVVGSIGIIVGGIISSKLLKWNLNKGIPVALTALFGFPADFLLCEEVSRSVADDSKEEKIIFDEILTPMIVGGFTTVTTGSIVVVSILVQTL
ncbi:MAG TPA: hypothetical protein VK111_10935 [Virgibacillus sp.]|nr:hypothetical protein [Virgibacillus sp.]